MGANMDEARLRQLVPSARRLTVAFLPGFVLMWHKLSADTIVVAARTNGLPPDYVDELAQTLVRDDQSSNTSIADETSSVGIGNSLQGAVPS